MRMELWWNRKAFPALSNECRAWVSWIYLGSLFFNILLRHVPRKHECHYSCSQCFCGKGRQMLPLQHAWSLPDVTTALAVGMLCPGLLGKWQGGAVQFQMSGIKTLPLANDGNKQPKAWEDDEWCKPTISWHSLQIAWCQPGLLHARRLRWFE